MSIAAVLGYVKDQLDEGQLPQGRYKKTAVCRISPLVPDVLDRPYIHAWTTRYMEERATMTRSAIPAQAGFKKSTHEVALYVKAAEGVQWEYADTGFFGLIEMIMAKLRAGPLPVSITDNDTGAVSQVVAIGERFNVQIGAVRGMKDRRTLLKEAIIVATVEEWVNA